MRVRPGANSNQQGLRSPRRRYASCTQDVPIDYRPRDEARSKSKFKKRRKTSSLKSSRLHGAAMRFGQRASEGRPLLGRQTVPIDRQISSFVRGAMGNVAKIAVWNVRHAGLTSKQLWRSL